MSDVEAQRGSQLGRAVRGSTIPGLIGASDCDRRTEGQPFVPVNTLVQRWVTAE